MGEELRKLNAAWTEHKKKYVLADYYSFMNGWVAHEAASEKENADVVRELTEALRLTVEYVGMTTLPPFPGWSWFEALSKYDPETTVQMVEHYQRIVKEKIDGRSEREENTEG